MGAKGGIVGGIVLQFAKGWCKHITLLQMGAKGGIVVCYCMEN
jgi:hypothetical protein